MTRRLVLVGLLQEATHGVALEESRTYSVGRAASCDLVVASLSVSRKHAELTALPGALLVSDCRSRNGTFVEYERIDRALALPSQRIRFGSAMFLLLTPIVDCEVGSELETDEGGPRAEPRAPHFVGPELTPGRQRVYDLLIHGKSEKEIGRELNLSPHTVHRHVVEIYRACGVSSKGEFLVQARPLPPSMSNNGRRKKA